MRQSVLSTQRAADAAAATLSDMLDDDVEEECIDLGDDKQHVPVYTFSGDCEGAPQWCPSQGVHCRTTIKEGGQALVSSTYQVAHAHCHV